MDARGEARVTTNYARLVQERAVRGWVRRKEGVHPTGKILRVNLRPLQQGTEKADGVTRFRSACPTSRQKTKKGDALPRTLHPPDRTTAKITTPKSGAGHFQYSQQVSLLSS